MLLPLLSLHALSASASSSSVAPPVSNLSSWSHRWDTTSLSTFADFRSPTTMTPQEVAFASQKYRAVSLEKCSGINSGVHTEEFVYETARQLKLLDNDTKVFMYLATDQQGIQCYDANAILQAHPEWLLKGDDGVTLTDNVLDVSNPDAVDWWVNIPLGGINNTGLYKGTPVSQLIDGVLADGATFPHYANISLSRLESLSDAKYKMIQTLQEKFTLANNGVVMANGISMYGGSTVDPRGPNDHNLKVLNFVQGVMNEHTGAFESINAHNASFNVETVSQDLDAIELAASMPDRVVFVQTWPGLYAGVQKYPPVADGGEPTPTNNSEWRQALTDHFPLAHALFLTVARENVYWFYGGTWYDSGTGTIACPQDPDSCPSPLDWYPDLEKPLGAPLGDRQLMSPYVWKREFEHATVHLDLYNWRLCNVTFH